MYQPSWSYASRWNHLEQHKMVTSHTDQNTKRSIMVTSHNNTRKDHHASTFMIIRIKHNPTIGGVINMEGATQDDIHTDQNTKRLSCINLHDHTHQAWRWSYQHGNASSIATNMEGATQDGYITHRSKHEKIILHQPSWSYAKNNPTILALELSKEHEDGYITHRCIMHIMIRIKHNPTILALELQHGRSYTRWLHHTPIKTRKDYHASISMIIRIKHKTTILALESKTREELRKMVTSHTNQYTKRSSCINFHDHTHQA